MIYAGCDVGSLSAEAVILEKGSSVSSEIIKVRPRPEQSANEVIGAALEKSGLSLDAIDRQSPNLSPNGTCSTQCHNMSSPSPALLEIR